MDIAQSRRWKIKEQNTDSVKNLAKVLDIDELLAKLLLNRGIKSPEDAKGFFNPSLSSLTNPFSMKGIEPAVERVIEAGKKGETVSVYGDYDVDGVTSVALLSKFFSSVGIKNCYLIPERLKNGYGLSIEGIDQAAALGAKVVITVDCGITSVVEADYASKIGIDLIITDHHTPEEELPNAVAVINPLQKDCNSGLNCLAGVGVAFNFLIALRSRLRSAGLFSQTSCKEPDLREYLDFVALGTIADQVPVTGENRILVCYGLRELARSSKPGIQALKKVADVGNGEISTGAVAFRLAPRLNAAGRLSSAVTGVKLLLSESPEEASFLAVELDRENSERQSMEQQIVHQAIIAIEKDENLRNRKSIVLASDKWHPGVIGIVASRIVEKYYKPSIIIAVENGTGKGSARSISNFHLYNALSECKKHFHKFGGHSHAAGITIESGNIEAFSEEFEKCVSSVIKEEDMIPEIAVDSVILPEELTFKTVESISKLRPFGMGNPEPTLLLKGVKIVSKRIIKDSHLKLLLDIKGNTFEAIGYRMADIDLKWDYANILFIPEKNLWNGREKLQLRLKGIETSEMPSGA
ncbi:MAG: single-stranded-DNA-specific exonuclease RecJ [Desulfuromonadales bacterium]|nr:single-stranded-DNA-specific exonuclease RecJ [Desulfuromonadales bacterium]